jgi:hypothetical protein
MKKFIIAGTRDFSDYPLLKDKLDRLKAHLGTFEVVSGTARGADSLGERYAEDNGLPIKRFIPDWDKLGKAAGYRRNEDMAKYADGCIVFWDGKSKGTEHMINLAKKYEIDLSVVKYENRAGLS